MQVITTNNALRPAGHYAQAIVHNGLIFISGQLAIDPDTGEKILGPIEEQAERALKNIELILNEAGCNKNHILKTTVYISDISLWDPVNKIYSDFFGNHRPARAIVPTKELHYGFKIEIDAIAAVSL
ncbi:MAG: RidA family protein [Anaerosolibacter sp.]|uniref:RidA family protein n=1 Tax=Anaerosolibacter sp. TaxID=1872527 RepID=UPI002602E724|nr:RidA family protein [Anaerosolibacter sp.]MDF2548189.1 RidA family protein [Anaerosolibacter sp.]